MLNPIQPQHLNMQQVEAQWSANAAVQRKDLFAQMLCSDLSDLQLGKFIKDHQEEVKAFGNDKSIENALSERTAGNAKTIDKFSAIIHPFMTNNHRSLMNVYSSHLAAALQRNNLIDIKKVVKNLITDERVDSQSLYCYLTLHPVDDILEMPDIKSIFEEMRNKTLGQFLSDMKEKDVNTIDFSENEVRWDTLDRQFQFRFIMDCLSQLSPETYKHLALFLIRHGFSGMHVYYSLNWEMVSTYSQMMGIAGDSLSAHILNYREAV